MRFWKLLLAIVLMVGLCDVADAKRRSGGGFRSSPSRSSPSRSSPTRSSPSRTRKATSSSRPKATPPKRSAADQKAYDKAKQSGTAFKSRNAAVSDFKTKHSSKYTSKYTSKPTTRPDHIPQTTSTGGKTYNVTYNQQYGGYGYMGPSGAWIVYDAMADAAMVSALMGRNNYYYDTVPVGQPVVRRGPSALTILLVLGGIAIVVVLIGVGVKLSSGE